eukprot:6598975-Pyramimonas_sp.AAC.1
MPLRADATAASRRPVAHAPRPGERFGPRGRGSVSRSELAGWPRGWGRLSLPRLGCAPAAAPAAVAVGLAGGVPLVARAPAARPSTA